MNGRGNTTLNGVNTAFFWSESLSMLQLPFKGRWAAANAMSDVRPDGTRLIVGMDSRGNAVVWVVRNPELRSANVVASDRRFQICFGTKNGERRAYFTETATATICDLEVTGGHLMISPTNVKVPGGG